MDLQIIVVAGGVLALAIVLKVLASSWRRAHTIDAGGVSQSWLVEQRVDRNQDPYS